MPDSYRFVRAHVWFCDGALSHRDEANQRERQSHAREDDAGKIKFSYQYRLEAFSCKHFRLPWSKRFSRNNKQNHSCRWFFPMRNLGGGSRYWYANFSFLWWYNVALPSTYYHCTVTLMLHTHTCVGPLQQKKKGQEQSHSRDCAVSPRHWCLSANPPPPRADVVPLTCVRISPSPPDVPHLRKCEVWFDAVFRSQLTCLSWSYLWGPGRIGLLTWRHVIHKSGQHGFRLEVVAHTVRTEMITI